MACRGLAQRVLCSSLQCPTRPQQVTLPRRPHFRDTVENTKYLSVDCSRIRGLRNGTCGRRTVTHAAAAAASPTRGWKDDAAWLTLLVTVFIYISGVAMLAPVLPSIIVKLNVGGTVEPAQAMGFIVSIYAAFLCVGSLVVGRASDYFGPKPVMVVTLFGGGATLLLSSLAQNYNQFVLGTGFFGGTVTCAQSYVGGISKNAEVRSSRVSTMQAVTSLGYVLGPGIGGVLHKMGTMAPLIAAGAMSMIACLAALVTLPHQPPVRAQAVSNEITDTSGVLVSTDDSMETPVATREELVKAARRDPVLRLMLVANFCSAFINPVFTFFSLIATTTLQWSTSGELALFFTLAGASAIPTSASVNFLVKRMGLMRMGITSMALRGVSICLMAASVIFVGGSPLCGTPTGAAIVLTTCLCTTICNTLIMAFKSMVALELVEARGGGAIRGEVLSWLTLIQFSANISAPMVMGWATSFSPVDGRYMFLLGVFMSIVASSILLRVMQMESHPMDTHSGTARLEKGSVEDPPKAFRSIQWASS